MIVDGKPPLSQSAAHCLVVRSKYSWVGHKGKFRRKRREYAFRPSLVADVFRECLDAGIGRGVAHCGLPPFGTPTLDERGEYLRLDIVREVPRYPPLRQERTKHLEVCLAIGDSTRQSLVRVALALADIPLPES